LTTAVLEEIAGITVPFGASEFLKRHAVAAATVPQRSAAGTDQPASQPYLVL